MPDDVKTRKMHETPKTPKNPPPENYSLHLKFIFSHAVFVEFAKFAHRAFKKVPFDMLCGGAKRQQYVLSFIMWSSIVGTLISGQVMDTFGRRRTIITFGYIAFASYVLLLFSSNYYIFTISTMLLGCSMPVLGAFTLPIELMPPKRRQS